MPKGARPGERRGGRKPGVPNKATADVKAAARLEGPAMLAVLVGIAKDDESPAAARVSAATKVLEYGHGKPQDYVELSGAVTSRFEVTGPDGAPVFGIRRG